jgi:hypothetical protein
LGVRAGANQSFEIGNAELWKDIASCLRNGTNSFLFTARGAPRPNSRCARFNASGTGRTGKRTSALRRQKFDDLCAAAISTEKEGAINFARISTN